jgi:hypothetical protein
VEDAEKEDEEAADPRGREVVVAAAVLKVGRRDGTGRDGNERDGVGRGAATATPRYNVSERALSIVMP